TPTPRSGATRCASCTPSASFPTCPSPRRYTPTRSSWAPLNADSAGIMPARDPLEGEAGLMSVSEPSETEAIWQVPGRLRLELLALLSADPTKPATMTYDEFLAWADEDTLAEWVDGRVVMTSPASAQHQYLAIFLATTLSTYVTVHDLGTVLTGPFQMK